jgi:hypothetical protein
VKDLPRAMSWIEFIEEHYPERDFTDFTLWEIGEIDFSLIYPNLPIFQPEYLCWLQDIDYLPYQYVHLYQCHNNLFWQCNFCNFWSEGLDQRIMEIHLLRCSQVRVICYCANEFHSFPRENK